VAVTCLANPASAATAAGHEPPPPIVVDEHAKLQDIDGFGIAQAFRRTELVRQLPEDQQKQITDLWFNPNTGAGFSILRFGIGSAPAGAPFDQMVSIQPTDPGGPGAPPQYVWDHDDGSQVWLAKIAQSYGVKRFYGDAWSAPGYMKDNGVQENGGQLCGLTGTACAADWRAAYARYLVQWTKFYKQEGIRITDLGFTNEPDFTASYASMRFTPAQAVEFVKILGPIARGTGLKIACCDSFGWDQAKATPRRSRPTRSPAATWTPTPATRTPAPWTAPSRPPTGTSGCPSGTPTAPRGTRTGTTAAATTGSPSRRPCMTR